MVTSLDDLGVPVATRRPAQRVVSLVPSLTEAIERTRPGSIVGATDWCTHPADLAAVRVRGTKNPDCRLIADLQPDIVIANMEENRAIDVQRLRDAGVPVWVTRIETLDESLASMRRMFAEALGWPIPEWLDTVEAEWAPAPSSTGGTATTVAVAVWRDPWMVVGSSTYTGDLLERLGLVNAFAHHADRYPAVDVGELDRDGIDLVLLPDEPYVFTELDGPEAFARTRTALVNGRLLTWYGPALLGARARLTASIIGP